MLSYWFNPLYLNTFLSVATLQLLAVISPGPDFAVVTRNSILYSRKVGVSTALGITAGVLIHMLYLILGFGLLVSKLVKFLLVIKIAGCLYLGYLGWKSIRASAFSNGPIQETETRKSITAQSAFWTGFLTNLLNPKAILFLLSLFTLVIDKNTPSSVLVICGSIIVLTTLIWFLVVSLSFSGVLRNYLLRFSYWIDRLTGGFLLFISSKIGLSCFD